MRSIITGLAVAVLLAPGSAAAQADEFLRINQSGGLTQRQVRASYSLELKRGLREYVRTSGSGPRSGGGLGGREEYEGVMHRLAVHYGVTDFLTIALAQSLKQPSTDDISVGVMVPELRVNLSRIGRLRDLPFELSTTVGSHVRLDARRKSSMVLGTGVEKRLGRWHLTSELQYETTLDDQQRENGLRYEAGASLALHDLVTMSIEAWGTLVWPDYAVFQQDHHGGPALRVAFRHFWAALGAGFGMQERPNKTLVDLGAMAKVGFRY